MGEKQQITLSLAFVALAVIVLAGQVTAKPELIDGKVSDPAIIKFLNDLLETTQRVKEKASMMGHSPMVQECEKDFGISIENLNKALEVLRKGISTVEGYNELENYVKEAEKAYNKCDQLFADNYKPSPFAIYDTWLKQLVEETEKQAQADEKIV